MATSEIRTKFLSNLIEKDRYKWYALLVVQMSILLVGVDSTISNLALPSITKDLVTTASTSAWVISAFFISVAVSLPAAGRLSDLYGMRTIFITGFFVYTLATAFCGLAPSIEILILMRVLQGMGGAALLANSNVISLTVFPLKQHGLALGINGTVFSIGYALGFTLGGQLIGSFGWRSIYYVNVPIGIIAILIGLFILKEQYLQNVIADKSDKSFDFVGFILSAFGIGATMLSIVKISSGRSITAQSIILFILGVSSIVVFVKTELGMKKPLLDIHLFSIAEFARGTFTRLLNNSIVAACTFAIPFFTQQVLKFSPLQSGLVMMPYAFGLAIVGPIAGRLSDKYGARWLTTSGFICGGIALIGLESISEAPSNSTGLEEIVIKLSIAMFLVGSAAGLFVSPNNSSALDSVPLKSTGSASGVIWAVSFIGSAFGTAYAASMLREVLKVGTAAIAYLNAQSLLFNTLTIFSFIGGYLCFTRRKTKIAQHE